MTDQERKRTVDRWVGTHAGRVLRIVRSFERDRDTAEDVAQDIWVVVFRKAHLCPDPSQAGSWIHSIAVRSCLDRKRRAERREGLFARWFRRDEDGSASGSKMDILGEAKLWAAIDALPPRQRDIVLYRYIDGHSTAETAQALGIAEGTVKASLSKALRTLRKLLDSPDMRELTDGTE